VSASSIVLIGPAHALPALCERLDSGAELHTFTDLEALEALDHVIRIKPRIVALEQEFSATSRGRALINRISDDPSLVDCEVRVVAHDNSESRVARRASGGAAVAVDDPKAAGATSATGGPLDQRGTRRAQRFAVRDGVEVLVDGNPAALVDISAVGVQVLSPKLLRPNQRVRIALSEGASTIRCDGAIAWASFEMPKGHSPRYRAGIEMSGADSKAVNAYVQRHKR
jgi:hypothetical protein